MSHITIILNRAPHPQTTSDTAADPVSASVTYEVPHDASDEEVGRAVKKLVKQIRDLGS